MPSSQQTVLILSPHPDDESLGCGGTIRLLTQAGVPVDVAYMTRGERGAEAPEALTVEAQEQLAAVRMREARQACDILGVRQVSFLNGADGGLAGQPYLIDELRSRLTAAPYSRVFCPWPQEKHPDHAATFRLLCQALHGYALPLHVWLYEVWTPLHPTLCVPIDTTMNTKVAAIQAHQSQLSCLDYLEAFRGLAAYRSLFSPTSRYAEAFITCEAQTLGDMG